jgi:S1-C subfamily serine protease
MNDVPEGALIIEVVEGSTAAEAGVQEGDIINRINGTAVKDADGGLAEIINQMRPGEQVRLEVYRNGETVELETTLKSAG